MVIAPAGGGVLLGAEGDELLYPPAPHAATPSVNVARPAGRRSLFIILIPFDSQLAIGVSATLTMAAFHLLVPAAAQLGAGNFVAPGVRGCEFDDNVPPARNLDAIFKSRIAHPCTRSEE
jgi:hypothetical protein